MKLTLIILILFISFSCISKAPVINPQIILNARLIRSFDTLFKDRDSISRKTYEIQLSIINNSSGPVSFWMMNCSWEDNILINNDYMFYRFQKCTRNFPELFRLRVNDTIFRKATISNFYPTLSFLVPSTRFGLIYFDSAKIKHDRDLLNFLRDKYYLDKIFWSNPLYLDDK